MINMFAVRFRQLMLISILVILFFALPAIFIPNSVIDLLGGEPAIQTIWPAFTGLLLLLLCPFFFFAAVDPLRHWLFAWLSVIAWLGITLFFLLIRPGEYLVVGIVSLIFTLAGGALLLLANRSSPASA